MEYTCTIHTGCVDASNTEEVLASATRIVTEALLTKDKEEHYEESN